MSDVRRFIFGSTDGSGFAFTEDWKENPSYNWIDEDCKTEFVLASDYDRLRARVAELEKDAERYRWLKNESPHSLAVVAWRYPVACVFGADEVDMAIEMAMGAQQLANKSK